MRRSINHNLLHYWLLGLIGLVATGLVSAQDDIIIEIPEGQEGATPIAIVPFGYRGTNPLPDDTDFAAVVSADLARSGQFNPLARADMVERPSRIDQVQFGLWRRLSVDYLVIGQVTDDVASGGYKVDIRLLNVLDGQTRLNLSFPTRPGRFRYTAHYIADKVYEELIGVEGVFRTRIAYITAAGAGRDRQYSLMVADADGHDPKPVVRSQEPLLSPTWSPDGRRLAYVSFESRNSSIFIQDVATGAREQIAAFKGINGAPAFSPDGQKVAMALSRSGNLEIYIMDLASRELTRLTNNGAIDTEPRFTPDGGRVIFTSDRGGRPQLYEIASNGDGQPQRLTFDGDYNARASLSPDGSMIALVNGDRNNYRIGVLERERNYLRIVSTGPLDESPSFAPNGTMVLYASKQGERGVLSAVPVYGNYQAEQDAHQLIFARGDIREPAWSPNVR